jgi:hypothetical protein
VRIITRFPLLLSVLLLGCNAINQTRPEGGPDQVRPDQAAPTQPAGDNRTPPQNVAPPAAEQPRPEPPPPGNQTRFDQIEGRLTLIQEQLLQLRSDSQRLQEQTQMLLNRLQLLSRTSGATETEAKADTSKAAAADGGEQLDMAIGQLMQVLNTLDNTGASGGEYGISTTYTRNGDWILLRYHRLNGSTWLADSDQWRPLQEQQPPPPGDYEVLVHRADQDRKGYVAVRFDRTTGRSWWLNDTRWQAYVRE